MEEFEGADWVLISDESPVDENRRDELLESFQVRHQPGTLPHDEDDEDEVDELEDDEDDGSASSAATRRSAARRSAASWRRHWPLP